jgi:mono/diheme cytochrome c family protein
MKGGAVPESEWLLGDPIGWRGPWGTTYASNLRLYAQAFTPETWVRVLRTRKDRLPPMPWPSIDAMSDQDLKAVLAYLQSAGPKGDKMPARVAPGEEPKSPYIDMAPKLPGGAPMPLDAAP